MFNGFLTRATFVGMIATLTLSPPAGAQPAPLSESGSSSLPKEESTAPERQGNSFPTHGEAARKGHGDVLRLKASPGKSDRQKDEDDQYAKALGFASAEEAGRAKLGTPLPIYMSRLFWLKQFTSGSDPQKFIKDTRSLIYPLHIDGNIKSSLTATEDRNTTRWQTTEWGSPKLIALIERGRRPQSSMVLLISPQNPLGLRFLGERKEGELLLTPIADIPKLGLTTGQQVSARDLFLLLVPVANAYNGSQLEGLKRQPPKP